MDGGAKKKRKPTGKAISAKLLTVLKKHQRRGMTMADLVKFLVQRPDRKRKKKGVKLAKATPAVADVPWGTPGAIAQGHREREERSAKASAMPPQAQLVVVPNVSRPIEEKDIAPYTPGDAIPPNASVIAVWRSAAGVAQQRDVTTMLRKTMQDAMRELKDQKEGKSKAENVAKRAIDDKEKATAETAKEKAMRLELEKKALDRKATDAVRAKWTKPGKKKELQNAAIAAGVELRYERDAKHPYEEKTVPMLFEESLKAGKGPIYDDYIATRSALAKQDGKGQGSRLDRPTSNEEIDQAMSKVPGYQRAVPSDDKFEVKGAPNPKGVSWVMNLDKSGEPGSHWVAVLITPHSVEYSDSFGDHPTPSVQERIVAAGKRLWPDNVKTLKINKIKRQAEDASSCGFHAMKFIRDRMSGESFIDATGFGKARSQVRKGEAEVREFEKRYPKFVQVGKGILDHPGDNMPDAVKRMLEMHGTEPVTSLVVVRTPVNAVITKILNVASLGAFQRALKQHHYDQLFHLAIVVNGKYTIEKNATVQFSSGARDGGERKPATPAAGTTIEDLFKHGTSAGFWLYDPRTNNCQDFVLTAVQGVGALTPDLRAFIKQGAASIFMSMPAYAGKLAKLVTDLGGRFDGARDKLERILRGRGTPMEGALRTIEEMNRSLEAGRISREEWAKKTGTKLNDLRPMKMPEDPITWLLRKVGLKKAAAWLHKKNTGDDLDEAFQDGQGGGLRLPGQYLGKPPPMGNKGPYSWVQGPLPQIEVSKRPLL